MDYRELGTLTRRKIGYGIVQPGPSCHGGTPVIKVNNLISGLTDITFLDTTSKENSDKYKRTELVGGELIVSVVGTVGITGIVPTSFVGCNLVRATALIDISEKWLSLWVKYYIDSSYGKSYIKTNLNTTVQPTLNISSLATMPIPVYTEQYMKKAVNILQRIDKKIEINNMINNNLAA